MALRSRVRRINSSFVFYIPRERKGGRCAALLLNTLPLWFVHLYTEFGRRAKLFSHPNTYLHTTYIHHVFCCSLHIAIVVDLVDICNYVLLNRESNGVAATAVAALKGGKVVGIVVTDGGSGYTEVRGVHRFRVGYLGEHNVDIHTTAVGGLLLLL